MIPYDRLFPRCSKCWEIVDEDKVCEDCDGSSKGAGAESELNVDNVGSEGSPARDEEAGKK